MSLRPRCNNILFNTLFLIKWSATGKAKSACPESATTAPRTCTLVRVVANDIQLNLHFGGKEFSKGRILYRRRSAFTSTAASLIFAAISFKLIGLVMLNNSGMLGFQSAVFELALSAR
jgi:hypothetical protein